MSALARIGRWLGLLLALSACSLGTKLPEGRIRCEADRDCPPDWSCRPTPEREYGLCFRTPLADAGAEKDAGASPVDAGGRELDAAPDADASTATDAQTPIGNDAMVPQDASSDASLPPDGGPMPDAAPNNTAPQIMGIANPTFRVIQGATSQVTCLASDPDSDPLTYAWTATLGSFVDATLKSAAYKADAPGEATLRCTVSDNRMGQSSATSIVRVYPQGLLALFPFQGDSNDRSGRGNHATLNGLYGMDRAGVTLGAALLNGVDENITVSNEPAFDLDGWSVVMTLNPEPANHTRTLISKASSGFGAGTLLLYADNDPSLPRRLQYAQGSGSNLYSAALGTYVPELNKFLHFAITRSSTGELRAYADGVLIHTSTGLPTPTPNDAPLVFGNGPFGGFAGTLDEIQVYDRVLSAAEVTALRSLQ